MIHNLGYYHQKVTKKLNFKQEPQYAPIRHGGHEAGDFFLVSSN